jgi:hypothetical protein
MWNRLECELVADSDHRDPWKSAAQNGQQLKSRHARQIEFRNQQIRKCASQ